MVVKGHCDYTNDYCNTVTIYSMNKPAFKEKGSEQYYRDDEGNWIKCDETTIHSLWSVWVMAKGIKRYRDDDGFLVFDYKKES